MWCKQAFREHAYFLYSYVFFFFITLLLFTPRSTDILLYHCYAIAFFKGSYYLSAHLAVFPYCSFILHEKIFPPFFYLPLEYPLLSVIPFSIPLFFPASLYGFIFAVFNICILGAIYLLLKKYGFYHAEKAFLVYCLCGQYFSAINSFDALPSILILICIIFVRQKRIYSAYIPLIIGIFLKVYPVVLVIPLFIGEQKLYHSMTSYFTRIRGFILFILTSSGFIFLSFIINFSRTMSVFQFYVARPIEIESFPATIIWLTSFFGFPVVLLHSFRSNNLIYAKSLHNVAYIHYFPGILLAVFFLCFVSGIVYILFLQFQNKISFSLACLSILLLLVITSKVFSAQYLLWLTPLIAYEKGLQKKWVVVWSAICLSTFVVNVWTITAGYHMLPFILIFFCIRNGIVLFFFVSLLHSTKEHVSKNTIKRMVQV